ncbi:MAG: hypothetical protein KBA53_13790 [Thermoclostridium sp.]|nr:hypothetical protein [Thermoclostridium sp.]
MQPAYGELLNMEMFRFLLIGISIIAGCTSAIVYLWGALSRSRKINRAIIMNVNETIVIYNGKDKPCYINTAFECNNIQKFLQETELAIHASGLIPRDFRETSLNEDALSLYEGEIELSSESDYLTLTWKMRTIMRKNKYLGRILVFNDITKYQKLLDQLDHKNKQLKEALEAQRKYAEIARNLAAEKERERIMVLVNTIAGDYLEQLRRSIQTMKAYANESNLKDESVFEAENDRMIQITRETIGKIRGTVKALHVSS